LVLKLMNLDIPHAMTSRELADTIRLR